MTDEQLKIIYEQNSTDWQLDKEFSMKLMTFDGFKKAIESFIHLNFQAGLDKEDMFQLVFGSSPSYELIEQFSQKGYGNYIGGFVDKWDWDWNYLRSLSKEGLYEIYKLCKEESNKNKGTKS